MESKRGELIKHKDKVNSKYKLNYTPIVVRDMPRNFEFRLLLFLWTGFDSGLLTGPLIINQTLKTFHCSGMVAHELDLDMGLSIHN